MKPELAFSPEPSFALEAGWKTSPFQMIDGIEVIDNMQERSYNAAFERQRPLEAAYKTIRDRRMLRPPFDQATFIGVLGRTGGGKSSFYQGIYRVAMSDDYLHSCLEQQGVSLEVIPVPFSLYAEAAKSETVRTNTPEYAISPDIRHGHYTPEEYARISALMKHDINTHILANQGKGKASLVLIEPSSPTAVPSLQVSETVQGHDRGLSPVYALAANEKTREQLDIFAIETDEAVSEEVVRFREKINTKDTDVIEIFNGDVRVVYTDYDEMTEGDDLDIRDLPPETQLKVQGFLSRVMAPPQAKTRSDDELNTLQDALKQSHEMAKKTDRRFFRLIQERLGMPDGRFHYVVNPHLLGRKTMDVDYFIHSLPVRLYPEIMEKR